jgi:putative ABC transport system permease protein
VIGVALKGLLGRKLRAALTAVAIVLGVAMISGTYVLTDTIKAAFNTVFTQVYQNTDASITGKSAIGGNANNGVNVPSLPASLLTKVRALPGVSLAEGGIADQAQLIGHDNKVISRGGAPSLAFSVDPAGNQHFNPLVLTEGHWPNGPNEIAIDTKTASSKHFNVGDSIGVETRGPVQQYKITGLLRFSDKVSSLGGATLAIFDLPTAQKIFNKENEFDSIAVAAKSNVTPQQLVDQIAPILPPTAQVRTGQEEAKQAAKDTNGFLTILEYFLLAFGYIALFVGIFVIANTMGITVAQRMRELATLRTLGATRRQVYWSVVLEALVIGVIASLVGLFLGLGLAKLLNRLFIAFGIDLPQVATVFATRTIVVALVVGTLVTLIAAIRPALRATRVQPIAAVREGAVLPTSRFARFGPHIALVVIAVAVGLMLLGLFGGGSTKLRLLALGIGAVGVFIGVSMLAPTLVPPIARVLGFPAARYGGAAGMLARGNSIRNPSRTASTASALMIGLTLVTLVSVLAAGLKTTFEDSVNKLFVGDYALTSQNGFTPSSTASENALRGVKGVTVVSGVRAGQGKAFGSRIGVTAVEPTVSQVIDLKWTAGSADTPAQLGNDGAIVAKSYAKDNHLVVGSPIDLQTPTGETLHLKLHGIFDPPKGGSPFGDITISAQRFDKAYPNPQNLFTFVKTVDGVTDANTTRLTQALASFPDAKIQTKSDFTKSQESGINLLLRLLYVLLSLSIIISLFGIVNTLVLTVFERTREIGMLRAVGMTRRQVRNMIRHESIITALLGAALGIPVGVVLALMVGKAIDYPAFTIPWGTLVVFIVAAIIAGLIAAIFPARRAGRLNILDALKYE